MGNKRNRRSRRHETPSPERELSETQVETPMQGNETLTNVSTVIQEPLGENENRSSLIEPSQISNEIQVWTENFEQKNKDRIMKMREEMENKFDAILKEIRTSKTTSTITNPRSEINGMQNSQPSGSKSIRSNGVHASNIENSDTENEDDHPLRASDMRELRNPARPLCQNEPNLDETIISERDSEEEDYHSDDLGISHSYRTSRREIATFYSNGCHHLLCHIVGCYAVTDLPYPCKCILCGTEIINLWYRDS